MPILKNKPAALTDNQSSKKKAINIASQIQKERLHLQAKQVLLTAWLISQEMQICHDAVDSNTIKVMQNLRRNNKLNESQAKLAALRGDKWLIGDQDSSLTMMAIQKYDDHFKLGIEIPEAKQISKHCNLKIW